MHGTTSTDSPVQSNGAGDDPLRFVFLGESIVSDYENPGAITARSVLRTLRKMGHETRFLEPRLNRPTRTLLEQRGTEGMNAFLKAYPDQHYMTYDVPGQHDVNIWLGREATTADAIVSLEGTPGIVASALESLDAPFVARLWETRTKSSEFTHSSVLSNRQELDTPWRPALRTGQECESPDRRDAALVVVYDNITLAMAVSESLHNARVVSAGSADFAGSSYASAPMLEELYCRHKVALIVQGPDEFVPEYCLLPIAHGCRVVSVGVDDSGWVTLPVRFSAADDIQEIVSEEFEKWAGVGGSPLPSEFRAESIADSLVAGVRQSIQQQQVSNG